MSDRKLILLYSALLLTEAIFISLIWATYAFLDSINSIPTETNPYHPLLMFGGMFGMSMYIAAIYKILFELLPLYALYLFTAKDDFITKFTIVKSRWIIAVISLIIVNLVFLSDGDDFALLFIICTAIHLAVIGLTLKFHKNRLNKLIQWVNNGHKKNVTT